MNIIPTAYRVLFLLQLFIQHKRITYQQFKQAMEPLHAVVAKKPLMADPLSISVFRKYVKTLRFLGCDIITINQNNRHYITPSETEKTQSYLLKTHPFTWQPSITDWLLFMQFYLQLQPQERLLLPPLLWNLSPSLTQQLDATVPILDNSTQPQQSFEQSIPSFLLSAFPEALQTTIKEIERIQQTGDGILLWLKPVMPTATVGFPETGGADSIFPTLPATQTPLLCGFPSQLTLQDKGIIQLRLEDVRSHQQYLIPLGCICHLCAIEAQQLKNLEPDTEPIVQFKISGTLVHAYEKRENETIIETTLNPETNQIEHLIIEAVQVNVPLFFQRLKRYGALAVVLTPHTLRQQFISTLQHQQHHLHTIQ
jgi:hypothetical protein